MKDHSQESEIIVRTSDADWLQTSYAHYQKKQTFQLFDNAMIGIDPVHDSLIRMGIKAGYSMEDWRKFFACIGVSGLGLTLCVLAFLDPEPTTKLSLLVGGGVALVISGGVTALLLVLNVRPTKVVVSHGGFLISFN